MSSQEIQRILGFGLAAVRLDVMNNMNAVVTNLFKNNLGPGFMPSRSRFDLNSDRLSEVIIVGMAVDFNEI